MSFRVPDDFNERVKLAASFIASGRPTNRSFDSCFEMYDGDAVCLALIRRVRQRPNTLLASNIYRYLSRETLESLEREHADADPATLSAAAIQKSKAWSTYVRRFTRICDRISYRYDAEMKSRVAGNLAATWAWRLWNFVDGIGTDHCCEPEFLWHMMASRCEWAFEDPMQTNSIICPTIAHADQPCHAG